MENEGKEGNLDDFMGQLNKLNQIVNSFKTNCKITSYCFDKCVSYPDKSLSKANQKCIWNCTQRYIESDYFIKSRSKENENIVHMNTSDNMNNNVEEMLKQ